MRKHYLDNLRWAVMLQLIVMHTCMCFNSCGLPFYYRAPGISAMDAVLLLAEPWRQGAFFLAAGASMRYALQSRGPARFVRDRAVRILLPWAFAKLTLIPGQVYCAFRAGAWAGSFFDFMKDVYLPGFWDFYVTCDAQLWFLPVLLAVTALTGLVVLADRRDRLHRLGGRAGPRTLALLTLPAVLCGFVLHVRIYYYFGRYAFLFLVGYLVFSHDAVCRRVGRHWLAWTAGAALLLGYLLVRLWGVNYYAIPGGFDQGVWYAAGYLGSVACLALFVRFGSGASPAARYLSGASYCVYLVHQTLLVWLAYYIVPLGLSLWLNYLLVSLLTLLGSLAVYEALRRVPGVRALVGIAPPRRT